MAVNHFILLIADLAWGHNLIPEKINPANRSKGYTVIIKT